MMIQDDALWPTHLPVRDYLEQIRWPDDDRFVISPYCCADYTEENAGWHEFRETWVYGAVALIFSRTAAEEFLADPIVIERCRHDYQAGIDVVIGDWAKRQNIHVIFPTPSLVQHIGDVSTLWSTARAVGLRRATRFVGDEFVVSSAAEPKIERRGIVCGWISTDPPIVYHSMGHEDPGEFMPDEPITRFAMYLWHQTAEDIAWLDQRARQLRPSHRILHCVNDVSVCRELVSRGISAHFINQNAFLDERLFSIQPDASKIYDAVYTARMAPFKRHELAKEIPSLLIIGGTVTPEDSDEHFQRIKAALPEATFTYDGPKQVLNEQDVNGLLNKSRVGLCLSAVEGTMYAMVEYLLCGLPVVTTASLGGRDSWLDPRFTRVVADDPQQIAAAVKDLIDRDLCPHMIRSETLIRMAEHRQRLVDLGQQVYAAHKTGRDFARDFYGSLTNKLGEWCLPQQLHYRSSPSVGRPASISPTCWVMRVGSVRSGPRSTSRGGAVSRALWATMRATARWWWRQSPRPRSWPCLPGAPSAPIRGSNAIGWDHFWWFNFSDC
jgi:glycosyltransferase involved in cell wall biosynthesis